jgi:hypothetical protein
MDEVQALLAALRDSPTDLVRVVREIGRRQPATLCLSRKTVETWQTRDPAAWARVRAWLERRGVELKVT